MLLSDAIGEHSTFVRTKLFGPDDGSEYDNELYKTVLLSLFSKNNRPILLFLESVITKVDFHPCKEFCSIPVDNPEIHHVISLFIRAGIQISGADADVQKKIDAYLYRHCFVGK